jgi:phosphohistidine phosphatase
MHLYLVQHGEAVAEEIDPERPLTEAGRADVVRLAAFLADAGVRVGRVVHSGKLRALASAEILAAAVGHGARTDVFEKGLLPKDSPVWLTEDVAEWKEDTLLVGHQPFLSRFASRLLLGGENPVVVEFTPGTAACLSRRPASGAWVLGWMLPPVLLRR